MADETLSRLIKQGYSNIRAASRLGAWVLPEPGFARLVDEVGDKEIIALGESLGLAGNVKNLPDLDNILPGDWQEALKRSPVLSQFEPVVVAFMEAAKPALEGLSDNKDKVDRQAVYRNMSVVLMAPFTIQGKELLAELTGILGVSPSADNVIRGYARAIDNGKVATLEKASQCILKYGNWSEWAKGLEKQVRSCRYTPKPVAVTPVASDDLTGVLATMIEEGKDGNF